MSPEPSSPDASIRSTVTKHVSLSPWVNERFPGWDQLLSAHDIARLTRRPRWVLLGMMVLGRFPRRRRFHGRRIGWLRSDVLDWMAGDVGIVGCQTEGRRRRAYLSGRQMCLPLKRSPACLTHNQRGRCSTRRGKLR
jgi:predicted DNA-binding transcriptional regulator AlpA